MIYPQNIRINRQRMGASVREKIVEGGKVVFSWAVDSEQENELQSAFRVSVSSEDVLLLDSGWMDGTAQEFSCLSDGWATGERLTVKVTLRDAQGRETDAQTDFYLGNVQWTAQWIAANEDAEERATYFRREFVIEKAVRSAVLYSCGIGWQELTVNGQRADDSRLDPAFTDYTKSCQYAVIPEVQHLLKQGANCLSAVLGGGWRRTKIRTNGVFTPTHFHGRNQLILMLDIHYEDGTSERIQTDGTWTWSYGAITMNSMFHGEIYDARLEKQGWNEVGFDGEMRSVQVAEAPGGVLRPMLIPPIREKAVYRPILISKTGENKWAVDFGQNIAGVVRMHIPALEAGHEIVIRHAEIPDEDGTLYFAPIRKAKATDTYISNGQAATWQPTFTYHGFRYAEITGWKPREADIEAVQLHTDLDKYSSFRCGSGILNAIQKNIVMTERDNMHSVLTDCPQRDERMAWMNDATVRFEETPFNFETGAMFRKIVRDVREGQREDGAISCTAPYTIFGQYPADPVCSSYLVAAWQNYLHNGDIETIEENFEGFEAWERCLLAHSENYIVNYSYYGDWAAAAYACEGHDGAKSIVTPGEFMSTGYSYYNCVLLAKFAHILGKEEKAAEYEALAERVKAAMLEKWYDAENALMATGSQACQAFSLWLGILPEADRARAAKHMRDDLVEKEYRFTTGNLCTRYLLDMLSEYGYADEAYELMTREEYPSFGFMLQQEATTIWERLELKKEWGMNSHNHPMYGAAGSWLYMYLAGIRPTGAGFGTLDIMPRIPEKLQSAHASLDTVKGRISVRWVKRYGGTYLYVDLPHGTTANVTFGNRKYTLSAGTHCCRM